MDTYRCTGVKRSLHGYIICLDLDVTYIYNTFLSTLYFHGMLCKLLYIFIFTYVHDILFAHIHTNMYCTFFLYATSFIKSDSHR